MKKAFLCALLALLLALSCTTLADTGYEYTQELVYDEFHLFIPSTFKRCTGYVSGLLFPYCENPITLEIMGAFYEESMPYIDICGSFSDSERLPFAYSDAGELAEILAYYACGTDSYIPVKADECAGILCLKDMVVGYRALIFIPNRQHMFHFEVTAATAEETLEITYELLEHIVAPEMPLEDGMSPVSNPSTIASDATDMIRPAPTPNPSAENDAAGLSPDSVPNNSAENGAAAPGTDSDEGQSSLAQKIQTLIPRFTLLFMLSL